MRSCTVVAVGALVILLSAGWRDRAISPGPLARQHAQLLENNVDDSNCVVCHAGAERTVAGWTASLAFGHGERADQSQRCMECHDESISKPLALAAHNLPAEALRQLTHDDHKSTAPNDVACAACHREHQGAQFDLTAISDAACQSCHQTRYDSFSQDHPDFGEWPYERRTRIVFNHASHQSKHFSQKNKEFDCRMCHVEEGAGGNQLLASYDVACASCHDETIATSVAKGVPILSLPTLDVEALKEAGHDIGDWPEDAIGDFDGELPPTMKLLLASDPDAAKAMTVLGENFSFFDVDPGDAAQLEACATLAASIKNLLEELVASGVPSARDRLRGALGYKMTDEQAGLLFAAMPQEVLDGAAEGWLPSAGVAKPASGESAATGKRPSAKSRRDVVFDATGSWKRDDAMFSIRYTPAAHADPVLASWLEAVAATPELAKRPVAAAALKELTNVTAPGLCASCHSVEQKSADKLIVNWRANDGANERRGFTKFSHGPHLLLSHLADCTSCHTIDNAKSAALPYVGYDPHSFTSDFKLLSKQQCMQCHTAKAAGESCQKCHNYHVDAIEAWRLK